MKKVVIVGGGPSGLMVAHQLVKSNLEADITILDANNAVGRKFLVAGHGGFNLSNNKKLADFVAEYNHSYVKDAVSQFTNDDTVGWLDEIGIETYIGSSGKLFPKVGIKPIQVLNAWLHYLTVGGVKILTKHKVVDFNDDQVSVQFSDDRITLPFDYLIFAVGGCSWKSTGSNGLWTSMFANKGVVLIPFQSSNSGIEIYGWKSELGGTVLKNIKISKGDESRFGDVVLTNYGIEGAPVYALSNAFRKGNESLVLDFKPTLSSNAIHERFKSFNGSKSEFLKSIKISKEAIVLMKQFSSKEDFNCDSSFLKMIQCFPLKASSLRPIDEVISTVGGVDMDDIDQQFKFRSQKQVYCVGEMLDWDAPTGGYLLQGCFATAFVAAKDIIDQMKD